MAKKPIATIYCMVDASDGELSTHVTFEAVKEFLDKNYQEHPDLYEVEIYEDDTVQREVSIPDGWGYVEPFTYRAVVDIRHETENGFVTAKNVELTIEGCRDFEDANAAVHYHIPEEYRNARIDNLSNLYKIDEGFPGA